MSSRSRKRKHPYEGEELTLYQESRNGDDFEFLAHHRQLTSTSGSTFVDSADSRVADTLQALYIPAYEADIVRGPSQSASTSLEVVQYVEDPNAPGGWKTVPAIGSALIQLGDNTRLSDVGHDIASAAYTTPQDTREIWVDRYDARLLLEPLPAPRAASIRPPESPTGWSDLPSDAEDTFFLSSEEIEDYRREQRRRQIEKSRQDRLQARLDEDDVIHFVGDKWDGSDEEPDETSKQLMQRTATHLAGSPNPAQLEMRILANHGNDKRFSFLRGRWSRFWNLTKAKARLRSESGKQADKAGMISLAGYGSGSDSEDEQTSKDAGVSALSASRADTTDTVESTEIDEEAQKEARRKRFKEWREKRQAHV